MHLAIIYAIMTLLNFWHYSGLMLESKILSPSFSVFHLSQCQFLPKVVSPHGGRRLKYQMSYLLSASSKRRKSYGVCRFGQENEENSSPEDPQTIGLNQFKFISEVITLPRVICTDWLRCRSSGYLCGKGL